MGNLGFNLEENLNEVKIITKIIRGKLKFNRNKSLSVIQNFGNKTFYKSFLKFLNSKKFKEVNSTLDLKSFQNNNIILKE